nr:immunoglobulin light chain junction region [Macaca mulatta]MPO04747.1 immunoglobulin light chain junction region [Macaca mulatta]MPO13254.1 immunoglobulin light chain junction region [Macaca mulatta]
CAAWDDSLSCYIF